MKKISIFLIAVSIIASVVMVNAAPIPRESAPLNATEQQIIVAESFIDEVLDDVKNGMGYADARAKTNNILFNAWLNGQTNGYSYGELTAITNNAIFQYRDMYLRPNFYIENKEKVRAIITDVITQYANGEVDYTKACFNAYVKIYQSVNPAFNPNEEFAKDICYRDIPAVDSSLFIEETVSDVFVTLWQNAYAIDLEKGTIRSYIAAVARNAAFKRLSKQKDCVSLDDIEIADDNFADRTSSDDFLWKAVMSLGEPDNEIFVRYYKFDEKLKTIAKATGLNISTVKTKLSRGKRKLKRILSNAEEML